MPTPEPRFEVPPEYADVYERAYRRAYEHGLSTGLAGDATEGTPQAAEPPRTGRRAAGVPATRGRRIAVPQQRTGQQRTGHRGEVPTGAPEGTPRPTTRGGARRAGQPIRATPGPTTEPVTPPPPPTPLADVRLVGNTGHSRTEHQPLARPRKGHRGVPRTGSTLVPLLGLLALVLMLLAGAFVLGRVTAGTGSESGSSLIGRVGPVGPVGRVAADRSAAGAS